jgi:cytoskeletal protein RodZ
MSEREWPEEPQSARDRVLDAYVRALVTGEPDAQFRVRVMRRISSRHRARPRGWLVPLAVAAALVVAGLLGGAAWFVLRSPTLREMAQTTADQRRDASPAARAAAGQPASEQSSAPREHDAIEEPPASPAVDSRLRAVRDASTRSETRADHPGFAVPGPPPLTVSALDVLKPIDVERMEVDGPPLAPIEVAPLDTSAAWSRDTRRDQ